MTCGSQHIWHAKGSIASHCSTALAALRRSSALMQMPCFEAHGSHMGPQHLMFGKQRKANFWSG